jgi:hypothetical protein
MFGEMKRLFKDEEALGIASCTFGGGLTLGGLVGTMYALMATMMSVLAGPLCPVVCPPLALFAGGSMGFASGIAGMAMGFITGIITDIFAVVVAIPTILVAGPQLLPGFVASMSSAAASLVTVEFVAACVAGAAGVLRGVVGGVCAALPSVVCTLIETPFYTIAKLCGGIPTAFLALLG